MGSENDNYLFRDGGNSYDLADALRKFVGAAFAGTRAEAVDYLPYEPWINQHMTWLTIR